MLRPTIRVTKLHVPLVLNHDRRAEVIHAVVFCCGRETSQSREIAAPCPCCSLPSSNHASLIKLALEVPCSSVRLGCSSRMGKRTGTSTSRSGRWLTIELDQAGAGLAESNGHRGFLRIHRTIQHVLLSHCSAKRALAAVARLVAQFRC